MPGADRIRRMRALLRYLRRRIPFGGRGPEPAGAEAAAAPIARRARRRRSARQVLWCHADNAAGLNDLTILLQRVKERDETLDIVLTTRGLSSNAALGENFPEGARLMRSPSEESSAIRSFLDRRRPDVCVWAGSSYAPNLIAAAIDQGVAVINVNASFTGAVRKRARVVRRSLLQLLQQFDAVFGLDPTSYAVLQEMGLNTGVLRDFRRLANLPSVPPHDEALRSRLAKAIGNRPVWMASGVNAGELSAILTAHRDAARLTHRLLLVLRPNGIGDADVFASEMDAAGLSFVRRSAGQEPAYDTQVILDDTEDEMGLWLRIAPTAFLGCSMIAPGGGIDPMAAAALGSAVLHGPHIGRHRDIYDRLTAAGGAVQVGSAKSLAEAVCEVAIPDRAAAMAHAAWTVESEAAEVAQAVEEAIAESLGLAGEPA